MQTREIDFINGVKSRGGITTGKYVRINMPIGVECSNGHKFELCPTNLLYKGWWCDECSTVKRRAKSSQSEYRRRPYTKGPRCKHLIWSGKNKGLPCKRKSYISDLCRYHSKLMIKRNQ